MEVADMTLTVLEYSWQAVHAVCASADAYVLTGHGVHSVFLDMLRMYVPTGHGLQ
jgi:hypothetical protein